MKTAQSFQKQSDLKTPTPTQPLDGIEVAATKNHNATFVKWSLLRDCLVIFAQLGFLYTQIGAVFEAEYYLNRGLAVGTLLEIPKIRAAFLVVRILLISSLRTCSFHPNPSLALTLA